MQVVQKYIDQSLNGNDKCKDVDKINPELKAMIDKIAVKEGFTTYKLIVNNIPPDGSSYLGVLTEVTVQDSSNNNHLNLFIKSILPNAEQLKMISLPEAYCKEVYFYLELSKLLEKLQADAQIPQKDRYKFVKSYSESTTHHIIMENMNKKGYAIMNRFNVISLEFAEKAIKLLAKFHALGFVLQEKQPKYFEEKIMPLRFPFKYDEGYYKFYTNMADNAVDYLEGSENKIKLKHFIPSLFKRGDEYTNNRDSTLTICHGDFRPNNIMIKMTQQIKNIGIQHQNPKKNVNFLTQQITADRLFSDRHKMLDHIENNCVKQRKLFQENQGKITNMVPVDYQVFYHGSPLIDLLYFIFGATDRDFRRKHLDYLKNFYYDTMKWFLKYFDMNVQQYYPREEYEELFKERLDFGLFHGIWYLQSNLAREDNIMDFSKKQVSEANFGKNDLAKLRMQELVDEFIDWGYL